MKSLSVNSPYTLHSHTRQWTSQTFWTRQQCKNHSYAIDQAAYNSGSEEVQFIWRLESHTNLKPNYHNSGLGAVLRWGFGAKRLPDQGAKLTTFYRNGRKFVRLYPAWGWSTMKSSNTNSQRPRLCQNFLFWFAVARLLSNSCTLIMTLSYNICVHFIALQFTIGLT